VQSKIAIYAVIRFDPVLAPLDEIPEDGVTVVAVVPTLADGQHEVDRLNAINADRGARYAWQHAPYFPEGRHGLDG
jgi:hypothetical protein